jgi:hypothetical protein
MTRILCSLAVAALAAAVPAPTGAQGELPQKLAAAKQAAAANQKALRSYSWLEKTELSLKGEVRSTTVNMCRYGADGKVVKTPVVQPPPPPERKRGLKGRIVENKKEEMKEELEAAVALVHQYLPPSPDLMQAVMSAGAAATAQAAPGRAALTFPGYLKAGDGLTLTFDSTVQSLQQIDVNTWLNQPDQTVTLRVAMASLPDGTNHPATVVLGMPKRNIEVTVTNSNYQKLAQ